MDRKTLKDLRARYDRHEEDPTLTELVSEYTALEGLCVDLLEALTDAVDAIEDFESTVNDLEKRLEAAEMDRA